MLFTKDYVSDFLRPRLNLHIALITVRLIYPRFR